MIDLNEIAVFVRVVEAGSFAGAARSSTLPTTTISRRVRKLEDRLGVRLLQRTTRSLSLTDAGRAYYDACSSGLEVIQAADQNAAERQTEPAGVIRLSAPGDFAASLFADVVAEFLSRYPKVKVEVLLTDERLDLIASGIDIALRTGQLQDSALVARKLGPTQRLFYASPNYIGAKGKPQVPSDLRQHDCIIVGNSLGNASWMVEGPTGTESVSVSGRVSANTIQFALRAAVAGLGIALLPTAVAARQIRSGHLTALLKGYGSPRGGLYLVYPSAQHLSAAVRALIDHFVASFANGAIESRLERSVSSS